MACSALRGRIRPFLVLEEALRHGRPYPPPHHISAAAASRTAATSSTLVLPPTAIAAAAGDGSISGHHHEQQQQQQQQEQQQHGESLGRHVTRPPTQQELPTICPPISADTAVPATCAGALHALKASKEASEKGLASAAGSAASGRGAGWMVSSAMLGLVNEELQEELDSTALGRAVSGGLSGAIAMGVNVAAFMWLRTIMCYQQAHGSRVVDAVRTLYKQGGIPRFYHGFVPALVQAPVARFGDTAANAGVLALFDQYGAKDVPIILKTACGSVASAVWRVGLMPLDTLMTCKQVAGREGWAMLTRKVRRSGVQVLFHGAGASFAANVLGHYPWFAVYNLCETHLPEPVDIRSRLARNALMGFAASFASDALSNSLTVVKVCKQASSDVLSYRQTTQRILATDGIRGLLGRGLTVRLFANGLQGMTFGIVWKLLDDCIFRGQCPELLAAAASSPSAHSPPYSPLHSSSSHAYVAAPSFPPHAASSHAHVSVPSRL